MASSRIEIGAARVSVALTVLAFSPAFAQDTTTRVSVSTAGAQANNESQFSPLSISADGRFVAFASLASNLVSGDTNSTYDVYVRDRSTSQTTRESLSSAGIEGNASSDQPSISADGRYVAFLSAANNLVAGDTNTALDVFVRDRVAGVTTRASVSTAGGQGFSGQYRPQIASGGTHVVFESVSANLVGGDTNNADDIFVRDLVNSTTTRASVSNTGTQANAESHWGCISSDGRYVAFESYASNLVVGDTNGSSDVFVRDRVAATTVRVSVDSLGAQGNAWSIGPSLSADGRFVAYESMATNLVAGDTNVKLDVFLHDRLNATTVRASVDPTGLQSNDHCSLSGVSDDGSTVSFTSEATNLVPGDTNGMRDVFLRDFALGTTLRASVDTGGAQANGESWYPALSSDGYVIAFHSYATNLVAGDTNARLDTFVRERTCPVPFGYCTPGTTTNGCLATMSASGTPSASATSGFTLTCTGIEGQKSGMLFYGVNGTVVLQWGSGGTSFLCIKSPTQRTPSQNTGGTLAQCNGTLSIDLLAFLASNPGALGQPIHAGQLFHAQAWFRDPPAFKTTNLSDGLTWILCP